MPGTQISLPLSGVSPFWGDPVSTAASLPGFGDLGEVRIALDTGALYYWDGNSWEALPGNGDVTGPASSANNDLVRFSGTTGKVIKVGSAISLTNEVTGVLPLANGGTNAASFTASRLVAANAGATALAPTAYTEATITTALSDITTLQGDVTAIEADIVTIEGDIVDLQNDKVDKIVSVNNTLPRFSGTGGDLKETDIVVDDSENITGVTSLTLTGSTSFLKLTGLTTAQRNALTPSAGMIVFNTDDQRFQGYFSAQWEDLHGWGN